MTINLENFTLLISFLPCFIGFWMALRTKLLRLGIFLVTLGLLFTNTIPAVINHLVFNDLLPNFFFFTITPILGIIGIIILGLGGIHILYDVINPLKKIKDYMLKFSSPETSQPIDPKVLKLKNEIGDLARAFQNMIFHLKESTFSKEYFENVISSMADSIIISDSHGKIMSVNPAMSILSKYSKEELTTMNINTLFEKTIERKPTGGFETKLTTKSGDELSIDLTCAILSKKATATHIKQEPNFIYVARDITDRVRIEKTLFAREQELNKILNKLKLAHQELQQAHLQVIHAEKLASIGQLAAGVAHEINNPLGYVNNNLEMLEKYFNDFNRIFDLTTQIKTSIQQDNLPAAKATALEMSRVEQEIDFDYLKNDIPNLMQHTLKGAERIKTIILDLRTFAREDTNLLEQVKIEHVINSVLSIVQHELEFKAKLIKNYSETPFIQGNAQKLGQVFINLLLNAAQAIEKDGVIEIRTYYQNGFACVDVQDNGKGIPKENFLKIFDPFFTTKPINEGTGLGLSISYEIIKNHNGKINVQSQVGIGTTFTIMFPVKSVE